MIIILVSLTKNLIIKYAVLKLYSKILLKTFNHNNCLMCFNCMNSIDTFLRQKKMLWWSVSKYKILEYIIVDAIINYDYFHVKLNSSKRNIFKPKLSILKVILDD